MTRNAPSSPHIQGLTLFLAVVGFASTAEAHLVTTGLGPVYDGAGHLLSTPEDWATVLGLALLAGLRGAAMSRIALFAIPAAWLIGGIAGVYLKTPFPDMITALLLLIIGSLVASDWPLPKIAIVTIAGTSGILHGYANGIAFTSAAGALLAVVGVATIVFVITALVSALVVSIRGQWPRIAVRAAGSWLAATGILLAGWTFRKG